MGPSSNGMKRSGWGVERGATGKRVLNEKGAERRIKEVGIVIHKGIARRGSGRPGKARVEETLRKACQRWAGEWKTSREW